MSTILVTGAAGYIGSHFVRRVLSRKSDVEIIAVDNLSLGHRESLPKHDRIRFFGKDVGDFDFMSTLFKTNKIDAVVHFAAYAFVGESQENPFKYFDNNVVATLNLFKAMQGAEVDKIVFSSSCSTYGNPDYCPIDENHPQRPVSVYGMTKFIIEKAIQSLADAKDWSYVSLRYFNAAGCDDSAEIGESHAPETHIIPLALQAAIGKTDQLNIWGDDYDTADGTCVRDYVHVNDLADAHLLALDKLKDTARLSLNLGSSVGASVKEVIRTCEVVSGRKIKVNVCARRPGDAVALFANHDKATEILGWQPQYSLEKIVETAWRWEQNRKF